MELYKFPTVIRSGEKEGYPVVSKGNPIRGIALPSEIGAINMHLEASFDGISYFPIPEIKLSFRRSGDYIEHASVPPAPTLAFLDPSLTAGLPYLKPVIDTPVKYEISLEFWLMGG